MPHARHAARARACSVYRAQRSAHRRGSSPRQPGAPLRARGAARLEQDREAPYARPTLTPNRAAHLEQDQEEVRVQRALVHLVDDDVRRAGQRRVPNQPPQQHACRAASRGCVLTCHRAALQAASAHLAHLKRGKQRSHERTLCPRLIIYGRSQTSSQDQQ